MFHAHNSCMSLEMPLSIQSYAFLIDIRICGGAPHIASQEDRPSAQGFICNSRSLYLSKSALLSILVWVAFEWQCSFFKCLHDNSRIFASSNLRSHETFEYLPIFLIILILHVHVSEPWSALIQIIRVSASSAWGIKFAYLERISWEFHIYGHCMETSYSHIPRGVVQAFLINVCNHSIFIHVVWIISYCPSSVGNEITETNNQQNSRNKQTIKQWSEQTRHGTNRYTNAQSTNPHKQFNHKHIQLNNITFKWTNNE